MLQHSIAKKRPSDAAPAAQLEEDFKVQKRKKRLYSSEGDRSSSVKEQRLTVKITKLAAAAASTVPARSHFAPLRAMEIGRRHIYRRGDKSRRPPYCSRNPQAKRWRGRLPLF